MEYFAKYLNLSYRYITLRNRSEKEVRDYLIRKKAEPELIEQVITRLKEQKFLNDETFARSWVLSRARFRPKGKMVLKMELQQKGVAKEIIEQVLSEEREDVPDELSQATQLIEKRVTKLKDKTRQEIYQKVGGFLARRGFRWEISKKAIDQQLSRD